MINIIDTILEGWLLVFKSIARSVIIAINNLNYMSKEIYRYTKIGMFNLVITD